MVRTRARQKEVDGYECERALWAAEPRPGRAWPREDARAVRRLVSLARLASAAHQLELLRSRGRPTRLSAPDAAEDAAGSYEPSRPCHRAPKRSRINFTLLCVPWRRSPSKSRGTSHPIGRWDASKSRPARRHAATPRRQGAAAGILLTRRANRAHVYNGRRRAFGRSSSLILDELHARLSSAATWRSIGPLRTSPRHRVGCRDGGTASELAHSVQIGQSARARRIVVVAAEGVKATSHPQIGGELPGGTSGRYARRDYERQVHRRR